MTEKHTFDFFSFPGSNEINSLGSVLMHPFFITLLQILVLWWCTYSADGGGYMIQRMGSAKDEKHSLYATLWFNILHFVVRTWPWLIVGILSIVVFPNIRYGRTGYPDMIQHMLPVGLKGVMIASLLAVFMSSVAGQLNWGTSYIVNDIWKRFIHKQGTDRHYILVSRIFQIILTVMVIYVAFYVTSIFELWVLVFMMTSGLGMVIILRWFWWRVNAWSESSVLVFSTVLAILTFKSQLIGALFGEPEKSRSILGFEEWLAHNIFHTDTLLISHLILLIVPGSIVVWLVATYLTKPVSMEKLETFYRRVHPPGFWGPIRSILEKSGYSFPRDSLKQGLIGWAAGTIMLWAGIYGIGMLFMLDYLRGIIGLAIAGGSAIIVTWAIKRLDFSDEKPKETTPA